MRYQTLDKIVREFVALGMFTGASVTSVDYQRRDTTQTCISSVYVGEKEIKITYESEPDLKGLQPYEVNDESTGLEWKVYTFDSLQVVVLNDKGFLLAFSVPWS